MHTATDMRARWLLPSQLYALNNANSLHTKIQQEIHQQSNDDMVPLELFTITPVHLLIYHFDVWKNPPGVC